MNNYIYAAMILGLISIVYAIILSFKKSNIKDYAFFISETKTILLMTALCIALGYFFLYYKLINPDMGGEGKEGYIFVAILGLICLMMGSYTIAYCFCSKIYVFEDKIIVSKVFSGPFEIYWDDIQKVEQAGIRKAARFTCPNVTFTVSGYNKQYKKFMTWVRTHLKGKTGKRLLANVEKNMNIM